MNKTISIPNKKILRFLIACGVYTTKSKIGKRDFPAHDSQYTRVSTGDLNCWITRDPDIDVFTYERLLLRRMRKALGRGTNLGMDSYSRYVTCWLLPGLGYVRLHKELFGDHYFVQIIPLQR